MKIIIFLLLTIAWLITPYSCTKGVDPVKPPTDTIPVVPFDSAYFLLLRDTMGKIAEISLDSNSLIWNKPLEIIRDFINGKWQVRLVIGGYSGVDRYYFEHEFVEYIYNASIGTDSIKYYSDNSTNYTTKRIYWYEKPSNYNYADSTFVYWFPDVAVNNEKMIVASRNDTLIIQDNGVSHGYTQLLTRVR